MPVTMGLEAEFTTKGLAGRTRDQLNRVMSPQSGDLIGLDGAIDTFEIRVPPSESSYTLLTSLHSLINIYKQQIRQLRTRLRQNNYPFNPSANLLLVGAYKQRLPLGIHVHFSNFGVSHILNLQALLHIVVILQFLKRVGPQEEMRMRSIAGYGGAQPERAIRVQGPNWFEWREPFSCLTPIHMTVLVHSCKLIAETLLAHEEDFMCKILATNTFAQNLDAAYVAAPPGTITRDTLHKVKRYAQILINKADSFNWNMDMRKLWGKQ